MDKLKISAMSHAQLIGILAAVAYFFLMFGNGIISLTHPDEVFYIQTAKEMIQHHSWMTPYIFDEPQFEKPIFAYWLFVAAIKAMGLTPFAARFMPSLFGIIGVLTTYWLSFMLFENKRAAFLSSVILASSFIYIALSRAVLTDMIFSILVILSLCFFYYGYRNERKRFLSIVLCFVFSALAVLAKGALGIIFPAGIIAGFLFYKRDKNYFKGKAALLGILLFTMIVVPWHWLMLKLYGHRFIEEYWQNVHVRRIFEAEHAKSNTWYFYLVTLVGGVFPWTLFLLAAVWFYVRNSALYLKDKDRIVFLFFIVAFVYLVVQSAQSKLASYVFPAFPALAILMGYYFEKMVSLQNETATKGFKAAAVLLAVFLGAASVAAIIFSQKYRAFISNEQSVYMFSFLVLLCGVLMFIFAQKKKRLYTFLSTAGVTVIVLAFLFLGRHEAEPWVSCKQICDVLNAKSQPGSVVLTSKFYARGVRFYTDREIAVIDINGEGFFSPHPVPFLTADHEILALLNSQPVTYAVVKESNMHDLERITQGNFSLDIIEQIGGKFLIRIKKTT